jgi:hypothetical protein
VLRPRAVGFLIGYHRHWAIAVPVTPSNAPTVWVSVCQSLDSEEVKGKEDFFFTLEGRTYEYHQSRVFQPLLNNEMNPTPISASLVGTTKKDDGDWMLRKIWVWMQAVVILCV